MAMFEYSAWDGSKPFTSNESAQTFDALAEYLLEYGKNTLRHIDASTERENELLLQLVRDGFLERDVEGQFAVTARGIRRMQDRALNDLFQIHSRAANGRHECGMRGDGHDRLDDTKPYHYGDPVAHVDIQESLKNSMARQGCANELHISEDDLVVHETELQTNCTTVLLLDMSGSMARYGKFQQAKRVAMALQALVRGRFQGDSLHTVGFFTYASKLTERQLAESAPKPVTVFDHRVLLKVPIDQIDESVPEHFTNIQVGLQLARRILGRSTSANKQIICITDGEPTAYAEGGQLVLAYPPNERTALATLSEVRRCSQSGIRISTVALIEDFFYLGLKNFVEQMARLSRGIAVYCDAANLSGFVFDSFMKGRRSRRHAG